MIWKGPKQHLNIPKKHSTEYCDQIQATCGPKKKRGRATALPESPCGVLNSPLLGELLLGQHVSWSCWWLWDWCSKMGGSLGRDIN